MTSTARPAAAKTQALAPRTRHRAHPLSSQQNTRAANRSQSVESESASMTTQAPKQIHPERKKRVKTALNFFSMAAWLTGSWLLLLTARMIAEYIFGMDLPGWASYIARIHGIFYVVYLFSVLNLAPKVFWDPVKWLTTALSGTIPVYSFVMEHKRRQEVIETFQLQK